MARESWKQRTHKVNVAEDEVVETVHTINEMNIN